MTSLHTKSARELARDVASGVIRAADVVEQALARVAKHGDALGCFLHIDADGARRAAEAIDRKRASGAALGALAGVPVALKDNLCTRGVPTTCSSRILEGYRPPYDATVVERLRGADAIVLGKTAMDEFAMGSSTETNAYGVVRNPWDTTRAPGGSSGGSAAAVGAALVPAALGSDTGGSVRQPGAFCGANALKPTYGRVSRYGLIAFASSLDQIGPMTRDVRDAAQVLSAIAGHDPRDATSADVPVPDYGAACDGSMKGVRVGLVREHLDGVSEPDVRARVEASIAALRDAGAELVDVSLPNARYALSVYYLVAPAEASSNLARFDGVRYGLRVEGRDLAEMYAKTRAQGFGTEVKRRIMLGTYALSAGYYDAFYLKAQRVRTLIRRDYDAAFAKADVLLSPTTPTAAFRLGEKTSDPLAMYVADIFTLPAPLAGLPAMSTPCGRTKEGLPVGVQLTAPVFEETRIFRASAAIEARCGLAGALPAAMA